MWGKEPQAPNTFSQSAYAINKNLTMSNMSQLFKYCKISFLVCAHVLMLTKSWFLFGESLFKLYKCVSLTNLMSRPPVCWNSWMSISLYLYLSWVNHTDKPCLYLCKKNIIPKPKWLQTCMFKFCSHPPFLGWWFCRICTYLHTNKKKKVQQMK